MKNPKQKLQKTKQRDFQRAVLRGLGVALPPLLTIVILFWIFTTLQLWVFQPVEYGTNYLIAHYESYEEIPEGADLNDTADPPRFTIQNVTYLQINGGSWIPKNVYDAVTKSPGPTELSTAHEYYYRYSKIKYTRRVLVLSVFFLIFIFSLYFLGRFLAYGVGRVLHRAVERVIKQLPGIRAVYASVKQVTDFVFTENEVEFKRVAAVEYPRKGIWSLGFVTGESMLSIRNVAAEPVVSVLIPTSPMPATGYTITLRKSEIIELDITFDQAFQFIVSCGVVIPVPESQDAITRENREAIKNQIVSPTS